MVCYRCRNLCFKGLGGQQSQSPSDHVREFTDGDDDVSAIAIGHHIVTILVDVQH